MLREGKFFGLFNIVSFPNNLCNSSQDLMQGDIFLAMMILMIDCITWMRRMMMWTTPIFWIHSRSWCCVEGCHTQGRVRLCKTTTTGVCLSHWECSERGRIHSRWWCWWMVVVLMDAESYVKPRLHHSVPLPKCSEKGGKTEDGDVGSCVKWHRQECSSPLESVWREAASVLMLVVVLMDLNLNLNNIHRSVPLPPRVFRERRSQWRWWCLCGGWWM